MTTTTTTAPATVVLVRWDSASRWARAPFAVTCAVLAMRAQYLAVRTPTGEEIWVDRSVGTVSAPRGGLAGVQGAPAGERDVGQWRAWTLSRSDLSAVWVENDSRSEAAAAREARHRQERGGARP